jgi:hypothetical protein
MINNNLLCKTSKQNTNSWAEQVERVYGAASGSTEVAMGSTLRKARGLLSEVMLLLREECCPWPRKL